MKTRSITRALFAGALLAALLTAGGVASAAIATSAPGTPGATGTPAATAAAVAGAIFVTNSNNNTVTAYGITARGDAQPTRTISKGLEGPNGDTFDSAGDLWVASAASNKVSEYTAGALRKASPKPKVVISAGRAHNLNGVDRVAFDAAGDLWADNMNSNTIVEYSKSELARTGSPAPKVTISADSKGSLSGPSGEAFDSTGDLWVSNLQAQTVVEYTAAQLGTSGHTAPAVTISTGKVAPGGLAFDADGALWVANAGGFSVVEYAKSELGTSGSPSPSVTISASPASFILSAPTGIAFDGSGDLWVTGRDGNEVNELSPGQLTQSGTPKPVDTIIGPKTGLGTPISVAIQP
jgi:sugar lactone lactonase YvrE